MSLAGAFWDFFLFQYSWSFFANFRQFFKDDFDKIGVFVHRSQFRRAIVLENVRNNLIDEAEVINIFFLPVACTGLIIGHTRSNFEEKSHILLIFDEETKEVWQIDERTKLVHVMFEVLLAVSFLPITD